MTIYDRSTRELACGLFEQGIGHEAAAGRLGIPVKAVRQWHLTYRAEITPFSLTGPKPR
jgi:transposase